MGIVGLVLEFQPENAFNVSLLNVMSVAGFLYIAYQVTGVPLSSQLEALEEKWAS